MARQAKAVDVLLGPFVPAAARRGRTCLTVLAYHGVDDPADFGRQLDHLGRHHEPVSLGAVLSALDGTGSLPASSALITFDDGHPSVRDVAAPLLRARGMPAVAFVVGEQIDSTLAPWWVEVEEAYARLGRVGAGQEIRRFKTVPDQERRETVARLAAEAGGRLVVDNLSSGDLRALEAMDVAVGNHSWSHPLLDHCPPAVVVSELRRADTLLREVLGHPIAAVAYPNGNVDERAVAAARSLGYRLGLLFDHRVASWPPADPLRVSRVRANADDPMSRFRMLTSGLHPAIHHAIGRP